MRGQHATRTCSRANETELLYEPKKQIIKNGQQVIKSNWLIPKIYIRLIAWHVLLS